MTKDVFVLTLGSLYLWADGSNLNLVTFLKTFNLFSWETLLRVVPPTLQHTFTIQWSFVLFFLIKETVPANDCVGPSKRNIHHLSG